MALSEEIIPRIPLGTWGDNALMWLRENASVIFDVFSEITKFLVEALADGLKQYQQSCCWPFLLAQVGHCGHGG